MSKSKVLGSLWKYSEEQLREAFDKVISHEDWRNEIRCVVKNEDLDITKEAIMFFTATDTIILHECYNESLIYSMGYRMGPNKG